MITSFFPKKTKLSTNSTSINLNGSLDKRDKRLRTEEEGDEEVNNDVVKVLRTKLHNGSTSSTIIVCPHVQELLKDLKCSSSTTTTTESDESSIGNGRSWYDALHRYTSSRDFQSLAQFVASQRQGAPNRGRGAIYPPPHQVFSFLHLTPIHKVKVVIVGQDPYHQFNQGHGLAFSVQRGVKIPPSLRNIYKELVDDPCISNFSSMPNHGCLERWANQGVLLLNSVLTVRDSEPNSHANKGWEQFTSAVIQALDEYCHVNHRGLVFLLWGNPASKKADSALLRSKQQRHTIICASHPSPLGATKTNSPFLGSRCFSKANEALVKMGLEPILWNLDN
jgi:uracil-DNA glycosylase